MLVEPELSIFTHLRENKPGDKHFLNIHPELTAVPRMLGVSVTKMLSLPSGERGDETRLLATKIKDSEGWKRVSVKCLRHPALWRGGERKLLEIRNWSRVSGLLTF